jgi:hypothetical protein
MKETPVPRSEALGELKAKLGRLPLPVSRRITELVTKVLPLKGDLDRIVPYAFLFTIVERHAKGEVISSEHTRSSWHELAGLIHGLQTGYRDEQEAATQYRRGRRARQILAASLDGVMTKWRKFHQLVNKHQLDLPLHNQERLARETLDGIRKALESMRTSLILEDSVLSKGRQLRPLSTTAKTYTMWRFGVPGYRGKWSDMYRLAVAWRLTYAQDVETFRSIVARLPPPSPEMQAQIASAWQWSFWKP